MRYAEAGLLRGTLAGVIGTIVMSGVIAGGRFLGLLAVPPPQEITQNTVNKMGGNPGNTRSNPTAGWLVAHVAYGAAAGVGLSVLRPLLPVSPLLAGLIYGGAVWALSYLGLMPALGLYPWPKNDSPSRLATIVVAHEIYGIASAYTCDYCEPLTARFRDVAKGER